MGTFSLFSDISDRHVIMPTHHSDDDEQVASPKRRKHEHGLQSSPSSTQSTGYQEGSIVRVAMRNFVTYEHCEFKPGPRLNLIIGPNGTGKSTIVCAMALGLGGNPSLLGRAKDIADFVKHGCDKAYIEIELYKQKGQNVIIKRHIKVGTNQSTWKINGQEAKREQVLQVVSRFNIQLDNLWYHLCTSLISLVNSSHRTASWNLHNSTRPNYSLKHKRQLAHPTCITCTKN
jgi:AAA15 family ATPase/GTPase